MSAGAPSIDDLWSALEGLTATPLFGVALTLAVYAVARALYARTRWIPLQPVALSIAALVAVLVAADIPYARYALGGDLLLFLLGPAVVALAVPLYRQRALVRAHAIPIAAGILAGAVTSIVTASGLAWALGGSDAVVRSLAPKSVTTPIAIGLVERIGGLPALTACVVVLTGCLGALLGPEACRWFGIRSRVATGLAVGTAAHGIGTARMLEEDPAAGAVSGLAIALNGLVTAALLAWLVR